MDFIVTRTSDVVKVVDLHHNLTTLKLITTIKHVPLLEFFFFILLTFSFKRHLFKEMLAKGKR